jgi:hypothetical protein
MAEPAAGGTDPLDAATASIKDSAKWLLATFGAVAAVVFAGAALSDISAVEDMQARNFALGSVGIAFLGIGLAIICASSVLVSGYTTLEDVKPTESGDLLIQGFGSLDQFKAQFREALGRQRERVKAYLEAEPDKREQAAGEVTLSNTEMTELNTRVGPILARAKFLRVKSTFDLARIGMIVGAALTLLGAFGFIYYTASAPEGPVVGTTPTAVTIDFTTSGAAEAARILGDSCKLEGLQGTAISYEGETVMVAIAHSSACSSAILELDPKDATVTASK